jgi:DNA adenine methylase
MDHADHLELIDVLSRVRVMVVLSGYENPTYSDALDGWEKHSTAARISGNRGAAVRVETVWLNQACSDAIHGGALFSPMRKEEKEEHGLSQ